MGTLWIDLSPEEKIASVQTTAASRNIDERAVEKDWWVTAVLKAMYNTECAPWLNFKGGTSLSKGWSLIDRFSEDADLSIGREFFLKVRNLSCAKAENNNQRKNLRKSSRDYIHNYLSEYLREELEKLHISGFTVRNHTHEETPEGPKPIDHDWDPTVIFVDYDSIFPSYEGDIQPYEGDIQPRVKIEISCQSMDEPFEIKEISTMLHDQFNELDQELTGDIRTVSPTRTFLEKIFLLAEELQKDHPRFRRMSRHLYDIEKIMDTPYGKAALADTELYKAIVSHRATVYHLGYVGDYSIDYPENISFIPTGEVLENFRKDYEENMVNGYIYGKAISFDELIARMKELQNRIRSIKL